MTLRKEYQKIVDEVCVRRGYAFSDETSKAMKEVAERFQALADKPPKMLTDDEKYQLWISLFEGKFASSVCASGSEVVDKIIAAHIAKQRAPEVRKVKIYVYRNIPDELWHVSERPLNAGNPFWTLIDSFEREVTL